MPGDIDTRTVERGGIRYRADVDPIPTPHRQISTATAPTTWPRSPPRAWSYVTVTVTLDCDHLDISERVAGVEYGSVEVTIDHLIDGHPITELVRARRETLSRLHQRSTSPRRRRTR